MFPISSRFLYSPPKCYRLRPVCISAYLMIGVISTTVAYAQEHPYINKQGSKIAVLQVSETKPAKRPTPSKTVVLAQAEDIITTPPPMSPMPPVSPLTPPLVVESTGNTPVAHEDTKNLYRAQSAGYPATQSTEKIPGLEAAKTPPPPPDADPEKPPIYVSGEFLDGYADTKVVARDKAQLIYDDSVLQGEELTYNRVSEVAIAENDVRLNREGDIFLGSYAQLHIPTSRGYFNDVDYWIAETGAHGESDQAEFLSRDLMTLSKADYTLCEPDKNGKYDWILTASHIELDFEKDEGVAKGAVLRFMNVPILATPWMSFPLSDKRRSGLLVPTFKIDSDNGFTYMQPYYWNIAPNYDATLSPLFMSKRGVGLQGEFRYLHQQNVGQLRAFYLPNDRNFDRLDRWAYSWQHEQRLLDKGTPVIGFADIRLDLNRVSDHKYWEDFPKMSNTLTSRLLNNEGTWRTFNNGFSTLIRVQRWQTLQSKDAYSTPPFDRTQLRLAYDKENISGFDFNVIGDYTRFEADRQSSYWHYLAQNDPLSYAAVMSGYANLGFTDRINNSMVDSDRGVLHLSASYPIRQPGWFVVPKMQLISRHYSFDSPVKNMRDQMAVDQLSQYYAVSDAYKQANIRTMTSQSITLPTFSLDTGLVFERNTSLFGKDYTQTLEPRMMYVYTPYQDQSMLPIYDSGAYDYNLASIYLENPYSGYDRIADAHMVIMGVGTRWQNPSTGKEVLNLNIAQRYRLKEQRVTLNNEPLSQHQGDWLLSVSTELVRDWRFDALVQYNPNENKAERSILRARWKPGPYRVMNFGYRNVADTGLTNDLTGRAEQLDFSWQWPLGSPWMGKKLPELSSKGGRWYSVGRINYSLRDKKIIDGVFGLEYQSCCWVARGVLERKSTERTKATTGFLFQLELTGLSRVGMDPLKTLKDSIDRYETISSERIIQQREFYLYE